MSRTFIRRLLITACSLVPCVGVPGTVAAWPAAVHQRIVELSVKLAPPALASQLTRHEAALLEGAMSLDPAVAPDEHRLHFDGTGGSLDATASKVAAEAIELLQNRGSFEALARKLGELSHLMADAAYPLNTSDSDRHESRYAADYAGYTARKLAQYPPLFRGYEPLENATGFTSYVQAIAERANRNYVVIGASYFPQPDAAMRPSSTFDDRGRAFGVTQLSFVDAVTATANAWLYVWRQAHGDLSGTPHLKLAAKQ